MIVKAAKILIFQKKCQLSPESLVPADYSPVALEEMQKTVLGKIKENEVVNASR